MNEFDIKRVTKKKFYNIHTKEVIEHSRKGLLAKGYPDHSVSKLWNNEQPNIAHGLVQYHLLDKVSTSSFVTYFTYLRKNGIDTKELEREYL